MNPYLNASILLCILIVIAGCSTAVQNSPENQSGLSTRNESRNASLPDASAAIAPSLAPLFIHEPIALPEKYFSDSARGSFEDSFLGSYECSPALESFGTNYTFFSGSGSPHNVHYTLVPVDNTGDFREVPLSSDVVNVSIYPDDFVALPNYIYQSHVQITIGPNVTGAHGADWSRDPYYPFRLNVTIDGVDAPGADDQLAVTKICSFHSQTRNMQPSPSFEMMPNSDIVIRPGDMQEVNLTIRNFGGGIRELHFEIPARVNESGWSFPLEADPGQLLPIPDGMIFSFDPPVMAGNNFRLSNDTLIIKSDNGTPIGNYSFPLVLCYRNLDPVNTSSTHFPFDDTSYCDSATSFKVDIL